MSASSPGCEGHAGVPAELRALALAALDRIEPALDRLRIEPPTPTSATCAVCPVCALLAALRGEHPELLQRLAEHAGGLVTALRQAMAEPEQAPPAERTASGSPKLVQRIPVVRVEARR